MGGGCRSGLTSAGPREPSSPRFSPGLTSPSLPRFSLFLSAPVLCLQPLRDAKQPVPAWAALPLAFQGRRRVSPSLPLPALGSGALSARSSHPHRCWQRRQGGRAPRRDPRVDLVLALNSGATRPSGFSRLAHCSSPARGPLLSSDSGCGYSASSDQLGLWSCAPPAQH